jgi:hypothetical protein
MIPRGEGYTARPLNCAADLGATARCPNCKQIHLRPGYCQALDPINAAKYPEFHTDKRGKVLPRHGADTVTLRDETLTQQRKREKPVTLADDFDDEGSEEAYDGVTGEQPPTLSVTICEACGAKFHPQRSTARYCSTACRVAANRKQKSPQ